MINVYLKIQKVNKTCLFELSWGNGQQLNAQITYPEIITSSYQEWQRFYRKFYSTQLRGKVINQGVVAPCTTNWRAKLVQAEVKLLSDFYQWLRSSELYDIRLKIGKLSKELEEQEIKKIKLDYSSTLNIFIICNDLELARLPWEAWEIGTEFAADRIRIVRQPINIIQSTSNQVVSRKARILAILGDDTNLNFEEEKTALKSLNKIVDVKFIGWKPGTDIDELKQEITKALTSDKGWDILFFAGHSNETYLTGGEIAIAPNTTLYLSEIERQLTIAKEKGLQVAIFNSCSGLSIANKLIDLGISQVAIMREPIHNQVATDFLVKFSQALAEYKDIHECLLAASQYLKLEKNLTYPSSYLVPSLFRHPAAPLFSIQPFGFKQLLKSLVPTPLEAVTISTLASISLLLPVQGWLLEQRVLVQAIYRQMTGQIDTTKTSPVLLVQIDNKSIKKAWISEPYPIDRKYLATLVDKLVELKAPVIGIDYLLDRPDRNQKHDRILAKSLKAGLTSSQPTWFVFPKTRDLIGTWLSVHEEIASHNWSLPGEIEILPGYMQLKPSSDDNPKPRPFAFILAISHHLQKSPNSPQPRLESKQDFWQQVDNHIRNNGDKHELHGRSDHNYSNFISVKTRLQPLTANSYYLHQMWLHPIIDFSISPKQVYQTIPAWELLENPILSKFQQQLSQQVVIIAAGGYEESGITKDNKDYFDLPPAIRYWRNQDNPNNTRGVLTGGEVHAYMTHHYLKNRMVIPIPDLWMIGLAIILGKFTSDYLIKKPEQHQQNLILISVASTIYALISLQLYISSAAILLPWLLPTIIFCFYVLRAFYEKKGLTYE